MRDTWGVCLLSDRLCLRPYRRAYVQRYHEWMEDAWLREMTSSERLTEQEEYDMQQQWIGDEEKATFIVFAAPSSVGINAVHMGGCACRSPSAASPPGTALSAMIGDVNLFMLPAFEAEEYAAGGGGGAAEGEGRDGSSSAAIPAGTAPGKVAEIMVMIAEPAGRRLGYAREAAVMLMQWGRQHLGIHTYVAKISNSNAPSLSLFQDKLGFVVAKRVDAFDETHLVCGPSQRQGVAAAALLLFEVVPDPCALECPLEAGAGPA